MSLPLALPRRESRPLTQNARRPMALVEAHPTNEELDAFRLQATGVGMTKTLERHVRSCDRCAQRLADMVWHHLWERLGA